MPDLGLESFDQVHDRENHKIIIQISDVHVVGAGKLHDTVDTLGICVEILQAIEAAPDRPDLVLFTGDLADTGEVVAYQRFRDAVQPFIARMGTKVLFQPGNHDTRVNFREHLLGWPAAEEVIDQVCWIDEKLRVIALDSTVLGAHHGELDDAQLAFLEEELQTRAELGTILALHHPPIPGPSTFLNQLTLREPERLAKVIAGSDVKMVLAGHTHHAQGGMLGGVPVWVATASAYQMDVMASVSSALRGLPGSAFTRIDITPEGAVATHIPCIADPPVYEVDFETLKRFLEKTASVEEIQAAFHPAEIH